MDKGHERQRAPLGSALPLGAQPGWGFARDSGTTPPVRHCLAQDPSPEEAQTWHSISHLLRTQGDALCIHGEQGEHSWKVSHDKAVWAIRTGQKWI